MVRSRLFTLSLLLLLGACSKKEPSNDKPEPIRPAKLFTVVSNLDSTVKRYPGTVESSTRSELAFRVSGQLNNLPAKAGKRFKKGDLLAQLDDADFQHQLKDRQAKYTLAKSQFNKIVELDRKGYTSSANLEQAQANLDAAEAALETAKDNLNYTRLTAPFDGIVAHVGIENHQAVSPNQAIISLRSDNALDVRFHIPEKLLGQMRTQEDNSNLCGQVTFSAYPSQAFLACFKEYESRPDIVTRSYAVTFTMPKIEAFPVLPGMAVTIEIDLSLRLHKQYTRGVKVPIESVFEEQGQTWVWKLNSANQVTKTAVTIDNLESGYLTVLDGLSVNDQVVAAGTSYLREGQTVKALAKERGL